MKLLIKLGFFISLLVVGVVLIGMGYGGFSLCSPSTNIHPTRYESCMLFNGFRLFLGAIFCVFSAFNVVNLFRKEKGVRELLNRIHSLTNKSLALVKSGFVRGMRKIRHMTVAIPAALMRVSKSLWSVSFSIKTLVLGGISLIIVAIGFPDCHLGTCPLMNSILVIGISGLCVSFVSFILYGLRKAGEKSVKERAVLIREREEHYRQLAEVNRLIAAGDYKFVEKFVDLFFDKEITPKDRDELTKFLVNKGYTFADHEVQDLIDNEKEKAEIRHFEKRLEQGPHHETPKPPTTSVITPVVGRQHSLIGVILSIVFGILGVVLVFNGYQDLSVCSIPGLFVTGLIGLKVPYSTVEGCQNFNLLRIVAGAILLGIMIHYYLKK